MNPEPDWGAHVRQAHRRFVERYLTLAQAHAQTRPADFDALRAEWETIETALNRAYAVGDWANHLGLMAAVEQYLYLQGHWRQGASHASQALAAAQQQGDAQSGARWALFAGLMQDGQGQYARAEAYYRQSLAGEAAIQAEAQRRLGWLAHIQGRPAEAEQRYQAAAAQHHQLGDGLF